MKENIIGENFFSNLKKNKNVSLKGKLFTIVLILKYFTFIILMFQHFYFNIKTHYITLFNLIINFFI